MCFVTVLPRTPLNRSVPFRFSDLTFAHIFVFSYPCYEPSFAKLINVSWNLEVTKHLWCSLVHQVASALRSTCCVRHPARSMLYIHESIGYHFETSSFCKKTAFLFNPHKSPCLYWSCTDAVRNLALYSVCCGRSLPVCRIFIQSVVIVTRAVESEFEGILGEVGVVKMYRLRLRPQSKILTSYSQIQSPDSYSNH
jgi:hypothetical protein